jgi:hypothetical protein
MLSETADIAADVEKEMKSVYEQLGVEYKSYVTTIAKQGVRIL